MFNYSVVYRVLCFVFFFLNCHLSRSPPIFISYSSHIKKKKKKKKIKKKKKTVFKPEKYPYKNNKEKIKVRIDNDGKEYKKIGDKLVKHYFVSSGITIS